MLADWTAWVVSGVGVAVAALVVVLVVLVGRWRRRRAGGSEEEDLSWADLLALVRRRRREREEAGLPPDDDLPPDEWLRGLLGRLPALEGGAPAAGEFEFLTRGGVERRRARRHWGNPTEVYLTSPLWADRVHGLVVNRSTGGLAILLDKEAPAGASLGVRSAEAPGSVPTVEVEVRHCRKAGKNFLIGCQFRDEVPWKARVWLG